MIKAKQYLACPTCGNLSGFTSAERILATADINTFSLDEDGGVSPDYAGETEVHWDTQETIEENPYSCNDCGVEFQEPVKVTREQLRAIKKQWKTLLAAAAGGGK